MGRGEKAEEEEGKERKNEEWTGFSFLQRKKLRGRSKEKKVESKRRKGKEGKNERQGKQCSDYALSIYGCAIQRS